jgi:hypothetical protein
MQLIVTVSTVITESSWCDEYIVQLQWHQFLYIGKSALIACSSNGNLEAVKLLLNNHANKDIVDSQQKWSALVFAAKQGHSKIVDNLLLGTIFIRYTFW